MITQTRSSEDPKNGAEVPLPAWNDPELKGGTMIRGALWLVQEIGEGNTFTKEQLRYAFPGIAQADRRLRDLRAFKWVILTNTEDASLMAEDQRFVEAGVPVWDPVARRAAAPQKAITAKQVQAVLAGDGYMCTVCGIGGAEPYMDDSNQTAVLSVTRRPTILPDGREETLLVTECKRCRAGGDGQAARADEVVAEMKNLDPADQRRLARWAERGRRGSTPLERAWNAYRRLPGDARPEVLRVLDV
ncbi:hypothetical protein [Streptomyces sp. NBC_00503]|uniref:hypothetical protein n=1 Tax=Streptomyces sp. NBC_00503 TaxID=2903659 RepID=UPI002E80BAC9|nr:hypothetical protein [Streptomyces sp. NBC_00503]WUD80387.1 hypothetical protein OG490_07370 [Streptomyces sp. NBC_00503]